MSYELIILVCLLLFTEITISNLFFTFLVIAIYKISVYLLIHFYDSLASKFKIKKDLKYKLYCETAREIRLFKDILSNNSNLNIQDLNDIKRIADFHKNLKDLELSESIIALDDNDELKKELLKEINFYQSKTYVTNNDISITITKLTKLLQKKLNHTKN